MFPAFIALALLVLAATLALPALVDVSTAARAHLAFAAGGMPLILAAYCYFVPVLTRSAAASAAARVPPWLALAAGLLAVVHFVAPDAVPHALSIASLGALVAASASGAWMISRGANAIGRPHPCLNWYVAGALCLAVASGAALAISLWPGQVMALKRLHMHLNTVGFIGLTAVGTLQVLMPTVAGPDAGVADRLRRDLAPAAAASVLVAAGAAWQAWLAWIGLALLLVPVGRLGAAWWRLYRRAVFSWHGAAPPLAASLAGFIVVLAAGALQSGSRAADTVFAFILLFLAPLVTGATAALLPVLLRPGVQTAWHAEFRLKAGRWAGARAALFLLGGIAYMLGFEEGVVLSLLALVLFVAQLSRALTVSADS